MGLKLQSVSLDNRHVPGSLRTAHGCAYVVWVVVSYLRLCLSWIGWIVFPRSDASPPGQEWEGGWHLAVRRSAFPSRVYAKEFARPPTTFFSLFGCRP